MITSFFVPKGSSKRKNGPTHPISHSETNDAPNSDRKINHDDGGNKESNKRQKQHTHDESPSSVLDKIDKPNYCLSNDVEELLSLFTDTSSEGRTWKKMLNRHILSSGFSRLAKFVATERKTKTIYPPICDTFSAFNLTPLHEVKVVIVGQDPYHGPNQGHGLCFSVRKGVQIPPSLRNMYKELSNDSKINFKMPNHGFLEKWSKQGVLLLNSVLTVQKGNANSHQKRGWEQFTDEVIRILDRESKSSGKGMVFLLWGKPASKKAESIVRNRGNNVIICTSHPSPLGASKTNSPFLGSKCFSRTNEALIQMGRDPIDWNVD